MIYLEAFKTHFGEYTLMQSDVVGCRKQAAHQFVSISENKEKIKYLPADDLMSEQNSAHLWVSILSFVDDCLENKLGGERK